MQVTELNVITGELVTRPLTQAEIEAIEASKPSEAEVLAQTVKRYDTATQSRLDEFARSGGYDSVLSCVTYANSTNAKFKLDALKMIKLRDDTWAKAYDIMQDVQNGEITLPSLDEYLSMLPVLAWS